MWTDNPHVLAFACRHHDYRSLVLANFDEFPQTIQADLSFHAGLAGPLVDLLDNGKDIQTDRDRLSLDAYGLRWLVGEGDL